MSQLKEKYRHDVVPTLMKDRGYANVMQVPRLNKVVLNIGVGEAITNAKAVDAAMGDLGAISGQRPVSIRSKKSISAFGLRKGATVGTKVTLRGQRMYDFLDKLIGIVLPRIREFAGVPTDAWDGRGNYTLGFKDQTAFPEIDYEKVDKLRGLEATIVTTARTDEEGKRLLELLGMPFSKENA
ncbi:MAG: 50S ribosomal protein L5 [Dehalococcoidia bacterium]|nr:50S ribosomal protein L5 [Dehalococcoidia bacterium]